MSDLDIVAVIPARYASTRLPGKPLIDLNGKTMIQRVYEQTKKAKLVTNIVVATDHEKIAQVVRGFGGKVILTPKNIKSGSDRIAFTIKKLGLGDIVVNIQGDEPLISPKMIDKAIEPLINDSTIKISTLVRKITQPEEIVNPNVVKVVLDNNNFAIYFSRSPIPFNRNEQDMKKWANVHVYYKHIGLYVFRKDFLLLFTSWKESSLEKAEHLEQLRIIENGYKIKASITKNNSISVDTVEDLKKVRSILKEKERKYGRR